MLFITSQWLLIRQLDGHFLAIVTCTHRSQAPIRFMVICVLLACSVIAGQLTVEGIWSLESQTPSSCEVQSDFSDSFHESYVCT